MKTISVNTYQFSELNDDAKKIAIEQWREQRSEDDYFYEDIYDDAKTIANIIGIDIDNIYFTGFWSQGDGACFEGTYCYAKGSVNKIREWAPEDVELHSIADRLFEVQKRHFFDIEATIKQRGIDYHEYNTLINLQRGSTYALLSDTNCTIIEDCLRDFMRWIYKRLESAYQDSVSDEAIMESIECNEVEFTAGGRIYEH